MAGVANAQPSRTQLLEEKLKSVMPDTARVKQLNDLSLIYLSNNPVQALQLANQALALSRKINFTKGEIIALARVGENEFRKSNHAKAVAAATESLKLAESQNDSTNIASAYRLLGIIYTMGLKEYGLALQYQLQALAIFKRFNNPRTLAAAYGNISWIYASSGKNLIEAKKMAQLGLHLADSLHDIRLVSYNYNSIGLIYFKEGKLDSALLYIDKSIKKGKEIDDKSVIVYNRIIKGNILYQQHKVNAAIDEFEQADREAKELSMVGMINDVVSGLSQCYAAKGDFKKAYQLHVVAIELKDSLLNWDTSQKILLIKEKFEQDKQYAKIALLEEENAHTNREKFIFAGLTVVLLASLVSVVVLVLLNSRQRAQTNKILIEKNIEITHQNIQLKEVNHVKDKFFSIIGHDLRGPLGSLKAMLAMVIKSEISDDEFKYFAPKLHQQVTGVGETLENLLQWSRSQMEGWTNNAKRIELDNLILKVFSLFNEAAKEKHISLIATVKGHSVYADENQVELIFRNLINNAIKFSSRGTIEVNATTTDEFIEVTVKDTGMGMGKEKLDLLFLIHPSSTKGTQGEKGSGLGLLLCKEMVKNNGGKISVNSVEGKGSTFHVFFYKVSEI
jgi:signal transduction histidine kinase